MKFVFVVVFWFGVVMTAPAQTTMAQETEAQGDFGEVFGIARSGSSDWDCETPEPLPKTRAEWEAVAAKIESGEVNKATVDAFISGKMPRDLHTEELGRKYNAAHYAYVRAKINNPSTGCEFDEYVVVPDTQTRNELFNGEAREDAQLTQEDLNAIWANMLAEFHKQRDTAKREPEGKD